jgi:glycosyltransferase involved in cell wall biosynthesis
MYSRYSSVNSIAIKPKTPLRFNTQVATRYSIRHKYSVHEREEVLPEQSGILFISSYPPRECGIATYTRDLIKAIENKFSQSFSIQVCAVEAKSESFVYDQNVRYILEATDAPKYLELARSINQSPDISIVVLQHEFGLYKSSRGDDLLQMLEILTKPVVIVFHTVLPGPDENHKMLVKRMVDRCLEVIVMTKTSKDVLCRDYSIPADKVEVIQHGTHLVSNNNKALLKAQYDLSGKRVLSTFGLLSSGKGIETTLDALPSIVKTNPEVVFLVIGKTHPEVVKQEGETYRQMLEQKVAALELSDHVRFINQYLDTSVLLEYLRLSDIYLFTSTDPNQAVSGTFSYAMSCGCALISTPFPQAREILDENTGILFDFRQSDQLASGINKLLDDRSLMENFSLNTLHKAAPSAWENSALLHAKLFEKTLGRKDSLEYSLPMINLSHLRHMTTDFGLIQFSKINQPDILSGYTIDDNARALIAVCMHYELRGDPGDIELIRTYLDFILFCQQVDGRFQNYVDESRQFTSQNDTTNLDDANGRTIWALGYLLSLSGLFPEELINKAEQIFERALTQASYMFSTRAMAFTIKGLYYHQKVTRSTENVNLARLLASRVVQMYRHESSSDWPWFEGYLTYANSILPESMLYAGLLLKQDHYMEIAKESMRFLIAQTFNQRGIEVISNRNWRLRGEQVNSFGEQPIDVAYSVLTLSLFYDVFGDSDYRQKMITAFNWFLGANRLNAIVYNPSTGGCYDGMEEDHLNLNQGAESLVSYLMARLCIEKYRH